MTTRINVILRFDTPGDTLPTDAWLEALRAYFNDVAGVAAEAFRLKLRSVEFATADDNEAPPWTDPIWPVPAWVPDNTISMPGAPVNVNAPTEPAPPETTPPETTPPETTPPAATRRRGKIKAAHKDINSRGKGTVHYRMAVDGDRLVWINEHPDCLSDGSRLAEGNLRASDRKDATYVEAPEGLVIVEINKNVPGPGVTYDAGITCWDAVADKMTVAWNGSSHNGTAEGGVEHKGVRKSGIHYVHVLEINGKRMEFTSGR